MQDSMIRQIEQGQCPFCGRKGFKNIAAHTSHVHGVTGFELREMTGLQRTAVICSPEYHEKLSIIHNNLSPENREKAIVNLKKGRSPEFVSLRPNSWERAASKQNLQESRNKEEHKRRFQRVMASVDRSTTARNRSPEAIARQIERVHEGQKRWMKRLGPEGVSEARRQVLANLPPETKEIMRLARIKASQVSKVKLPEFHNDPKWRANWEQRTKEANRKRSKILPEEYDQIKSRYLKGETQQAIADDYNVSRRLIGQIINGQKGGSYKRNVITKPEHRMGKCKS